MSLFDDTEEGYSFDERMRIWGVISDIYFIWGGNEKTSIKSVFGFSLNKRRFDISFGWSILYNRGKCS